MYCVNKNNFWCLAIVGKDYNSSLTITNSITNLWLPFTVEKYRLTPGFKSVVIYFTEIMQAFLRKWRNVNLIQSSTFSQMVNMFSNYNHKAVVKSRIYVDFSKMFQSSIFQEPYYQLEPSRHDRCLTKPTKLTVCMINSYSRSKTFQFRIFNHFADTQL